MAAPRMIDWVQHDIQSDGWSWRQTHPDRGFEDRRLNHTVNGKPRYTKAKQEALKKIFAKLVAELQTKYHARWWHYSFGTKQLVYDDGAGRKEVQSRELKKLAADSFDKFVAVLSRYHERKIIPGASPQLLNRWR
jgi:hypothetical protein